ncbi:MAG TPA: 50S ribosomal protein L21 [Actinomycetota bacterium]|nr:50S ribosomal protein L21 [Actinomycetota bacterium]
MYAVIRAGGKQHKVAPGDVLEIERVKDASDTLEFTPLLVVDDKGKARTSKSELAKARVMAKVVGESAGDKVDVYKYRSKTGYRRRAGHRQKFTTIQIADIKLTAGKAAAKTEKTEAKEDAEDGS